MLRSPRTTALGLRLRPRLVLAASIGLLLCARPQVCLAAESGTGVGRAALIAVDVFPIRFGSFLQMVAGGIFMVPVTLVSGLAYPFERNPGVFRENAELYVIDPYRYTFRRSLGEDLGG